MNSLGAPVDPETGNISFCQEMINVYSEVSYERTKGPKILSRIPQDCSDDISFDASSALEKNYDFVCAVDTNTVELAGKSLSVVGIVTTQPVWFSGRRGLFHGWRFDVPFCLEYIGIKGKPENFGRLSAFDHLEKFGLIGKGEKVEMIVDSDLTNLTDYNQKKLPKYGPHYLPDNVTLVYGSSDGGKEIVANKALAVADSVSAQCLAAVKSGRVPFNQKQIESSML